MKVIALLVLGLFLVGCGPTSQSPEFLNAKSIIGSNDFVSVPKTINDFNSEYLSEDLLDSIGRMELGCTVTHIGNRLVITAGHCLKASMFNFVKDRACQKRYPISWGVRGTFPGYLTSRCKRIVAAENSMDRDFAIIEVDYEPRSQFNLSESTLPNQGDMLTIYSHPMKRPLQWSRDCKNLGRGSRTFYHRNRIQYECDTQGGSSGAAVLGTENNEILAIHNSGTSFSGDKNKATPVRFILDKLEEENVLLNL